MPWTVPTSEEDAEVNNKPEIDGLYAENKKTQAEIVARPEPKPNELTGASTATAPPAPPAAPARAGPPARAR
jgi:hypothetical protein